MIYQIKNENLTVEVNSLGAELWSIKDNTGKEYLWQGDETSWKNRATNLFPFCGRMTNGVYSYQGKEYEMVIHGFAKSTEFTLVTKEERKLVLMIENSTSTYEIYPFRFRFTICYELVGSVIKQSYIVENLDDKAMYFAVGGHPGFQLPIEDELQFEDYEIVFEKDKVNQTVLSEQYFITETEIECPDVKDGKMLLQHDLFNKDALILSKMGKEVVLQSPKGTKKIRVAFPNMNYLAIWHRPFTKASYVCIEPWTSQPARQDVVEDIECKGDLIALAAGDKYENNWEIEII